MYKSIYSPTVYFDESTFYINQGKITQLKIYEILNTVVLTLFLHLSKHIQTNFTEDIEEKSVVHINQGQSLCSEVTKN